MQKLTDTGSLLRSASRRVLQMFLAGLSFCALSLGCQSNTATKAERPTDSHATDAVQADTSARVTDTAPDAAHAMASPLPNATATFDAAWTLVYETHFDPEFNGVDWEGVRDELRPRAAEATSMAELRSVLGEMISRLNQSHFSVLPNEVVDAMDPDQWDEFDTAGETEASSVTQSNAVADSGSRDDGPAATTDPQPTSAEPEPDVPEEPTTAGDESDGDRYASPGFEIRLLDDQVVVTKVRPGFPAAEADVRPGWILEAVGSRETADLVKRMNEVPDMDERARTYQIAQSVYGRLRGNPGSRTPTLRFRDGQEDVVELRLERIREPGVPVKVGNLPMMVAQVDDHMIDAGDRQVGYIAFNIWMVPIARPFHQAMDRYRESDGIIIDLRGNPGGVGGMAMGIAGHFFNDQQRLGTMKTRDTNLNFVANPRRTTADRQPTQPFAGPVAILVDEGTASTSEIFAGGLQAVGRARIFGSTTMGAALPARMTRLPNGDVLLHAFADYVDANGVHLEGRGVVPDEPITPTRSQLLRGEDPAVDAAVQWISTQRQEPPANAAA